MEDFAALFEKSMNNLRTGFNPGEKVSATVLSVGKYSVFVDVGATGEGVVNLEEFRNKEGEITVQAGDVIDVFFVSAKGGELSFTVRMNSHSAADRLQEIYDAGIPVEGKVVGERNGGFTVEIAGQEAFCPFSQIDLRRGEPETYIGNRYTFQVTEFNGRNLVVSRRKLLEKEAEDQLKKLQYELEEGDLVEGTVTKLMPFGAFVNLGAVEGLIPMSELAWGHVADAAEIVEAGKKVTVKVIKLDWVAERITLSLKQAGIDPWDEAEETYVPGRRYTGKVTKLMPFGAFVQLDQGLEGLVHISRLGAGRRINHPSEVVEEGAEVEVFVEKVDTEQRRISLSMEETAAYTEATEEATVVEAAAPGEPVREGQVAEGIVENIREFGVFIKLPDGQTGLLHASQVDLGGSNNRFRALSKQFAEGSKVEVVVDAIKGDRISLILKSELDRKAAEKVDPSQLKDNNSGSLGSLGSLFDGLDL